MTVSASIQLNDMMSSSIQHITSALNIMIDCMERTDTAVNTSFDNDKINEMRQHIDTANAELAETEERLNDIRNKANGAASATKNIESATRSVANASDNWLNKIAQIGAGYLSIRAVIDGVKAAIGLSDQVSQTTARLNLIVDDGGSVDELEARIRASAERSRASYQTTADAVAKMGMQAGESFNSNMELIAFVELLNKSFVTAGTSAQGIDSVMLQLTQSMAAGKLQGEELNAVLDNAQPIVANIKKYLEEVEDIDATNIKELASEGVITADVIKNAMFYAADDINHKFEQMPVTWEQLWVGFVDDVKLAFEPLTDELAELAASENIQEMFEGISYVVAVAAAGLAWVTDKLDGFVGAVQENWEIIRPILIGIAVIWAVVKIATLLAAVAQWGYNMAMYACPVVWIIALIIGLIVVIYAACAAISKITGTTISATGIIVGTVMTAVGAVANIFIGLWNFIMDGLELLQNIISDFSNFFANVFNDPINAICRLFFDFCDWVLGLLETIANAIDTVFQVSNLGGIVKGWRDNLSVWVNDNLERGTEVMQRASSDDEKWKDWDPSETFNKYYNWGANKANEISDFFKNIGSGNMPDTSSQYSDEMDAFLDKYMDMYSGLDGLADGTDETAKNTKEIAKNTQKTSELMDLVKDNWEKKLLKEYTSKATTITYDLSGMQNTYNNTGQNFNPVKEVERYLKKKAATVTEGI